MAAYMCVSGRATSHNKRTHLCLSDFQYRVSECTSANGTMFLCIHCGWKNVSIYNMYFQWQMAIHQQNANSIQRERERIGTRWCQPNYIHKFIESVCATAPTAIEPKISTSSVLSKHSSLSCSEYLRVERRIFRESIRSSISIRYLIVIKFSPEFQRKLRKTVSIQKKINICKNFDAIHSTLYLFINLKFVTQLSTHLIQFPRNFFRALCVRAFQIVYCLFNKLA